METVQVQWTFCRMDGSRTSFGKPVVPRIRHLESGKGQLVIAFPLGAGVLLCSCYRMYGHLLVSHV